MKIANELDFVNIDKKFNLEKISADEINIIEVYDIWDGPLSGSCEWQGREYYFYSFDQLENDGSGDKWPRKYMLIKLTSKQIIENRRLSELFVSWAKGLLNQKQYVTQLNNLLPQNIDMSQVIGWFDSKQKERNRFTDSYSTWYNRIK